MKMLTEYRLSIRQAIGYCSCAILLAGCSSGEGDRLVGHWEIADVESVSDQVSSDEIDLAEIPPKMTIDFFRSGKLRTTTRIGSIDSVKDGNWAFESFDEDAGLMVIDCNLGGQKTNHEIEFIDATIIEWIPPNMAGTTSRLQFSKSE